MTRAAALALIEKTIVLLKLNRNFFQHDIGKWRYLHFVLDFINQVSPNQLTLPLSDFTEGRFC